MRGGMRGRRAGASWPGGQAVGEGGVQPIIAPEHLFADEEGRRTEDASRQCPRRLRRAQACLRPLLPRPLLQELLRKLTGLMQNRPRF